MTIGQKLREQRHHKGLTLKQLAEETGLSLTYLSDVERGRTRPSLKTLMRVASGLGLSVNDLMQGVEDLGELTEEGLPPGLRELKADPTFGQELDEEWIRTLQRTDYRGKRPQTKDDWLHLFLFLRRILEPPTK